MKVFSFVVIFFSIVLHSALCINEEKLGRTVSESTLRNDSTTLSEELGKLPEGSLIQITEEKYDWYKVKLPPSFSGYVHSFYIETKDDETGISKADNLRIRSKPAITSPIIGMLDKKDEVQIIGKENEWLKIVAHPYSYAWIHKNLIKVIPKEELLKSPEKALSLSLKTQEVTKKEPKSKKESKFQYYPEKIQEDKINENQKTEEPEEHGASEQANTAKESSSDEVADNLSNTKVQSANEELLKPKVFANSTIIQEKENLDIPRQIKKPDYSQGKLYALIEKYGLGTKPTASGILRLSGNFFSSINYKLENSNGAISLQIPKSMEANMLLNKKVIVWGSFEKNKNYLIVEKIAEENKIIQSIEDIKQERKSLTTNEPKWQSKQKNTQNLDN